MKVEATGMDKMPSMIHLNSSDLPEIKEWKVGKTYKIVLEVKQISLSQDSYGGKTNHSAGFEIVKARPFESKKEYSLEAVNKAKETGGKESP